MTQEIELKLALSPTAFSALSAQLSQQQVIAHSRQFLGNTYYDYPCRFFAHQKMGLRVRQEDETFTLTLKTNGDVTGGLHARPEYNLPLSENTTPSNEQIRSLLPLDLPDEPLQPLFSTNFNRTFWLIDFQQSQIEVALDEGEIIAGDKATPICEMECELKQGNLWDLFDFLRGLELPESVYFSGTSKAQRGYQLGKEPVLQDWLEKWRAFLDKVSGDEKSSAKLTALLALEQQLIDETFSLPDAFFAETFLKTVERIGAFFNLAHFYVENGKLIESCLQTRASENQRIWNENALADLMAANQQIFDDIFAIIQYHSQSKDNLGAIQRLKTRLQQADFSQRMLDLMALVITEK